MKIQVTYDNGRIDEFSTDSFTSPSVFGAANILTTFQLRIDEFEEKGLWLDIHYHTIKNEGNLYVDDIPITQLVKGHKCLLLDKYESIEHVMRIAVDGETILLRLGDTIINLQAFQESESSMNLCQRISNLYQIMCELEMTSDIALPGIPNAALPQFLEIGEALNATTSKTRKEYLDSGVGAYVFEHNLDPANNNGAKLHYTKPAPLRALGCSDSSSEDDNWNDW